MQVRPSQLQSAQPRRKGAITVEMALTVPVLFLLVFALCQFSYVNLLRNTLTNACFEAARKVIIPGADRSEAEAEAARILNAVGVKDFTITITPNVITNETPEVTVEIEADLTAVPLMKQKWMASNFLKRTCTLKREALGQ